MATPAQIQANRRNAQKSTGPCSVEGKAAVRFNALRHGVDAESLVIPGEDPAALADLFSDYREQFHPVGPLETALVETIVRADWCQRRYARVEAEVIKSLMAAAEGEVPTLGAVFHQDAAGANALQKIFRRQQAALRDWRLAIAELRRLQEGRLAVNPEPPAFCAAIPPEIGFDPQFGPSPARPAASAPKGAHWLGSEPPAWRL